LGHVLFDEAVGAGVGPNKRGVHMHGRRVHQLRLNALGNALFEDSLEHLRAPTLSDTTQGAVIRELLVKPIPREPANGYVCLGATKQRPIMDDPLDQSREHQTKSGLGVDAGTPSLKAIKVLHLITQPR
jgi:hypothetical protein